MPDNECSTEASDASNGRICPVCKQWKLWEEFARQAKGKNGRQCWCRACFRVYNADPKQRQRNKESATPNRASVTKHYLASEKGMKTRRKTERKRREHHPERLRAKDRVKYAIRIGRLVRQPCEVCGMTDRVHAHHDDYDKPLEIRWLCYVHHREHHDRQQEPTA